MEGRLELGYTICCLQNDLTPFTYEYILICSNCSSPLFIILINLNREITSYHVLSNTEIEFIKSAINALLFVNFE